MQFHDITHNTQTTYILDKPGRHVFFCLNRSGELTFDLTVPGAAAYVFALFVGKEGDECSLKIVQHHRAPQTVSRLLAKSVLLDQAKFRYEGLIRIDKEAVASDAEQTNRNLILSPNASAFSRPDLEIHADDVACRHASTTSRPNPEHLFYAQSRGLNRTEAERMLMEGFVADFFSEMEKLGDFPKAEKYKQTILGPI
jgi:Fe-S cluster assembly protein SufD